MRRSKHTLSHYRLQTFRMGQLVPIGVVEALPGDTFQHSTSAVLRLAPLNTPVFHPTYVRIHHWFVPHRLVWPESENGGWEDFITGGKDGDNNQTVPGAQVNVTNGSIYNHLGYPQSQGPDTPWCTTLSLRAYNLIFNEFYRDRDLVPEVPAEQNEVQRIAWEKDYFTTARPWTQKGPDVTIPLADKAPVTGIGPSTQVYGGTNVNVYESGASPSGSVEYATSQQTGPTVHVEEDPNAPGYPNIFADLSQATVVKVNDLRRAFGLQRYAEARARFGSRYTEYLRYLGVVPSDARLQRPEYLGGGRARVQFSEVLQTSPNDQSANSPGVGELYGHGIAGVRDNGYRKFFEEHGYVITLASIRPKAIYVDGVPKMYKRYYREDFYQKELELIGQEPVHQDELWVKPDNTETIFGYSDRYESYRYQPSQVIGDFRSTLNSWHMARSFAVAPSLNKTFVDCNPSQRIFQSGEGSDPIWAMINHNLVARRLVRRNATAKVL